jgi:uncharacterized membrane protein YhaH (DUF805 family)
MSNLQILFSFNGRIRRLQWWMGSLIIIGIVLAFIVVVTTLVSVTYGDYRNMPGVMSLAFGSLLLACYLAMIWIQLALGVKRLHDREMSGWWMLLTFVPFGGFILLVMLGFLDGTQGPNKFGPSPKGIGGASTDRELGSVFS